MNVLKVTLMADPNDILDTRLMFHIEGKFDAFDGCALQSVDLGGGDKMEWQRSESGWITFGLRSGTARGGQGAGYLWSSNGEAFERETGIPTVEVCYEEIDSGRSGPRMSLHMDAMAAKELVKQLNLPVFMRKSRYGSYKFVIDQARVATSRSETCPICGTQIKFDRNVWKWNGCDHFVDVSYDNYLWMR